MKKYKGLNEKIYSTHFVGLPNKAVKFIENLTKQGFIKKENEQLNNGFNSPIILYWYQKTTKRLTQMYTETIQKIVTIKNNTFIFTNLHYAKFFKYDCIDRNIKFEWKEDNNLQDLYNANLGIFNPEKF